LYTKVDAGANTETIMAKTVEETIMVNEEVPF
jgi:hypothetical protein